jgi:hypothetical protein
MGERIDQFCDQLRQKLTMADSGLEGLKTKIDSKAAHVEEDVQSHLDRVKKRIDEGRAKAEAAQAELKHWAEQKKTETKGKIAELKAKHDSAKLKTRADFAQRYAAASVDVAVAAVDEAERASLEAWLARRDAEAVAHR